MYNLVFDRVSFSGFRLERVEARRGLGHAVLVATGRLNNKVPGAPNLPSVISFNGEIRDQAGEHVAEIRPTSIPWHADRADDMVTFSAQVSFRALERLNASRHTATADVTITYALSACACA